MYQLLHFTCSNPSTPVTRLKKKNKKKTNEKFLKVELQKVNMWGAVCIFSFTLPVGCKFLSVEPSRRAKRLENPVSKQGALVLAKDILKSSPQKDYTCGTLIAFPENSPRYLPFTSFNKFCLLQFCCFFKLSYTWAYELYSLVHKTNEITTVKKNSIAFSQLVSKAVNENISG